MNQMTWWRFWSDTFRYTYSNKYRDIVCWFIVPCHEDWHYFQPKYTNDNRKVRVWGK